MPTNDNGGAERRRRTPKPQPRNTAPEVVYTQPKQFSRSHLVVRLLTIVAVVIAIGMGLSIFFKVETITVVGAEKYSAWSVTEASGIAEGDSLLFFGRAGAAGRIIHQLPYIKSVRFGIKLPGTVNIIIEESPVAYGVQDTQDGWWLITSDGRVVEQTDSATALINTVIEGVKLEKPVIGELAVATENNAQGELIATTNADRLTAALEVFCALEANEILGKVASVDVTSPQAIEIWYGTQYQIKLGDRSKMEYKIAAVKQVVSQMSQYQTGILDASFTTFPDKVSYTPFSE